mgnify:CR=1 FL=1
MPRNYGPTNGPGDTRHRIFHINADHPNPIELPGSAPLLRAFEEEAIQIVGGSEKRLTRARELSIPFDPVAVVPVRDPTTDALTGGNTDHATIFALLYSLCRKAQEDADAAESAASSSEGGQ